MSTEPDFYGANIHTPYPFVGPYDQVTACIVDAQIVISGATPGTQVLLTRFRRVVDLTPLVEISTQDGVVISGTVVVSSFGDYTIWQVAQGSSQATLVVASSGPDLDYTGAGYEFIPHVISNQDSAVVEAVEAAAVTVAPSGTALTLRAGSNISFSVDTSGADSVVVVTAERRQDGPCTPPELRSAAYISRINGQGPDATGDLKLRGAGIWVVDRTTGGLKLLNVGKECCACEDYAELFRRLLVTNERLAVTRDWVVNNQYRYRVLLEYVKFLLRHQIVGGIDPADPNTTMSC